MATKKKASKKSAAVKTEAEIVQPQDAVPAVQAETIQNQSDHLAQLAKEASDLKAKVSELEAANADLLKCSRENATIVAAKNSEIEQLTLAYKDAKGEVTYLKDEIAKLNNGIANIKAQLVDAINLNGQLKAENDNLKHRTVNEEIAALKDQLFTLSTERDALAAQADTLKASSGGAMVSIAAASTVRVPRSPREPKVATPVVKDEIPTITF